MAWLACHHSCAACHGPRRSLFSFHKANKGSIRQALLLAESAGSLCATCDIRGSASYF